MKILKKINSIQTYLNVFESPIDIIKFKKMYNKKNGDDLVSLRVKETLDHNLYVRANTTDAQVLWDTFYRKYHVPEKLEENPVIVDLGANVGYTMAHFAFLYPDSRIIGVELDQQNYLLAKKNLQTLEDRCDLINAGIWSKDGTVSYDGIAEWGFKIGDNGKNNANALTMESLKKKYNLTEISFLKVDIEGAEKDVFENPGEWINSVKQIKMEIHPTTTIEEMTANLTKFGFKVTKDKIHPCAINAIKD